MSVISVEKTNSRKGFFWRGGLAFPTTVPADPGRIFLEIYVQLYKDGVLVWDYDEQDYLRVIDSKGEAYSMGVNLK
jgi:hypothetical protein